MLCCNMVLTDIMLDFFPLVIFLANFLNGFTKDFLLKIGFYESPVVEFVLAWILGFVNKAGVWETLFNACLETISKTA